MAFQQKSNSSYTGVQTSVNFAQTVENILDLITRFSITKDQNPQPYINAVMQLWNTSAVYIYDDLVMYNEIQAIHEMLLNKMNQFRSTADKQEFYQKEYQIKSADFLYISVMKALDRKNLLPKRTESATL